MTNDKRITKLPMTSKKRVSSFKLAERRMFGEKPNTAPETGALPKTQWKCQISDLKSPKKPVSPLTPGCARLRPHAGDIFSAGERFGLREGVMRIGNGKGRKNCPIFRLLPPSSGGRGGPDGGIADCGIQRQRTRSRLVPLRAVEVQSSRFKVQLARFGSVWGKSFLWEDKG
jgi:hypothetical protein